MNATEEAVELLDMRAVMRELAKRRPIFHSEADFQHALAWEIRAQHTDCQIRLERPVDGVDPSRRRPRVDVWLWHRESTVLLELKYYTSELNLTLDHKDPVWCEEFRLASRDAPDVPRHGLVEDIARVERAVNQGASSRGYALLLSNHKGLWTSRDNCKANDAEFGLTTGVSCATSSDGATARGRAWRWRARTNHAGRTTRSFRAQALTASSGTCSSK